MHTNSQIFQLGGAPVGLPVTIGGGGVGTYYFVDPTNGSDSNTGKTTKQAFASIAKAYDAATTNNNDVIVLAANSSHTVDSGGLTTAKNRVNFLSADLAGRVVQQGAKVQSNSSSDTAAFVLKNTGTRNSFQGIKFIQTSTDAAALTVVQDGGEGTLWDRNSFVFGVVDNLDQTNAYEFLAGSDSATYKNCLFGTETLLTSAARTVFAIDQVTASQEFKSNILDDCIFLISSSSSSALLLKVLATTDVLFTNLLRRPTFMASVDSAGGVALTNAVSSVSGLVKGTINFADASAFNVTNFCTTSDGFMVTGTNPVAATAGIAVTPA